jgi:hypothetical protein
VAVIPNMDVTIFEIGDRYCRRDDSAEVNLARTQDEVSSRPMDKPVPL